MLTIQLQIFSHLEPRDLLHLCRTNKFLRSILLDRNSLGVWRSARQNLNGLPDLPEDLSEPRYASLLFDKYCQVRCNLFILLIIDKSSYNIFSSVYMQRASFSGATRTRCCKHCLQNTEMYVFSSYRFQVGCSWCVQSSFSPTLVRRSTRIIPVIIFPSFLYG